MATRTDWRGVVVGICVGIAGGGAAIIWPTAIVGWVLIALGVTGAIMAIAQRYVGFYVNSGISLVMLIVFATIWVEMKDYLVGAPAGPRFEFGGIQSEHKDGKHMAHVQIYNTSEIPATSYYVSTIFVASKLPNNTNNTDVNNAFDDALSEAKHYNLSVSSQQITRGMGLHPASVMMTNTDFDAFELKTNNLFISIITIYSNYPDPIKRVWVTEVCEQIVKLFTDFVPCPTHNDYFFACRDLQKID